jgi:hypothetical protein
MARKDKKQIIGEPMTDEQIQAFLTTLPEQGMDPDFHALTRAYRSLRAHDFERFLTFFAEAGRNLEARSPDGQLFAESIRHHAQSGDYLDALKQHSR